MERPIKKNERLAEKLFLMLRTREGLREAVLSDWERTQFVTHRRKNMEKWLASRHLQHDPTNSVWTLTTQGKLLANMVMAELV